MAKLEALRYRVVHDCAVRPEPEPTARWHESIDCVAMHCRRPTHACTRHPQGSEFDSERSHASAALVAQAESQWNVAPISMTTAGTIEAPPHRLRLYARPARIGRNRRCARPSPDARLRCAGR